MPFGAVLAQTGGLGRFQALQVALLSVPILLMASHNLLQNFSAAVPPHRCRVPAVGARGGGGVAVAPGGASSMAAGGTSMASDGTSVASGGTSVDSGGTSMASGGTSVASGGTLVAPDGASMASGGTSVASSGISRASGGTLVASGGISVASGGTLMDSGGTSVASDGTLMASGGIPRNSGGTLVASGGIPRASGGTLVASGGTPRDSGGSSVASGGIPRASGGTLVASDGASVASGGTSKASGGTLVASGGISVASGGTLMDSGGTSVAPDGTLVASGGIPRASGGSLVAPDGSLVASGGSSMAPGGTSKASGGTSVAPDGSLVASGGSSTPPAVTPLPPVALASPSGTRLPPGVTPGWPNRTTDVTPWWPNGTADVTLGSCRRLVTSASPNGSGVGAGDTEPCHDGWEYDTSVYVATIVTEWDLVCGARQLRQMAQSIYMAGVLVGALLLGGLSDKFGRKALLLWSYFQLGVMGTCTAFAPNYASYCVFRFAGGMALSGFGLSIACLVVEWIPTPYRAVTVALTGFSYTLGQILLAGIAYAVPHWRWLQLTVSLPFFVFFLFSWWLAESARWLVLAGKEEKAVQILQRVAKINGREEEGKKMTVEFLKSNMKEELAALKSSYTISDLVRTPVIRHIFFCLSIVWFSISFSYYGLAMDLQNFGVSIYLIQVIFGAVDFPAKLVVTVSVSYIGRRVSLMVALALAGLVIIANIFVPSDLQTVRTTLAVIGKGCLSASFNCVFLYTTELYPTPIRQTGLGFGSTMARVGGIVAPLVKMMEEYYPFLPPAVYGVAPIAAAVAAGFLPETLNRPLPDTIEEVENRAKHKKTPNPKEKIPLHPQDTAVQKEP